MKLLPQFAESCQEETTAPRLDGPMFDVLSLSADAALRIFEDREDLSGTDDLGIDLANARPHDEPWSQGQWEEPE